MFQSVVGAVIGFGIVGELAFEGPLTAQPGRLASGDAANNVMGRAFTVTDGGTGQPLAGDNGANPHTLVVAAGGAGVFAGILANPKVYASYGTQAEGAFGPQLTLPNGTIVELVTGTTGITVQLPAAANVGDVVYFTNATGVLVTTAPGAAAPAASTLLAGWTVRRYESTGAGLAVIGNL